jgi:hypothetical protein
MDTEFQQTFVFQEDANLQYVTPVDTKNINIWVAWGVLYVRFTSPLKQAIVGTSA